MKKSQQTSQLPLPVIDREKDRILIPACSLTLGQALNFRDVLNKILLNCKVAKFVPTLLTDSLWDSTKSSTSFSIEIGAKILSDLQRLAKIEDSFEDSIVELIKFYESEKDLNIIFLPEVLEKRPSYTNYTSQLAHSLSKAQILYPIIKVLFDPSTSRLGIFCRRTKESSSFISQLTKFLLKYRTAIIDESNLPKTYQTNFAMLKQHLTKELPDNENCKVAKLVDSILLDLNKSS